MSLLQTRLNPGDRFSYYQYNSSDDYYHCYTLIMIMIIMIFIGNNGIITYLLTAKNMITIIGLILLRTIETCLAYALKFPLLSPLSGIRLTR